MEVVMTAYTFNPIKRPQIGQTKEGWRIWYPSDEKDHRDYCLDVLFRHDDLKITLCSNEHDELTLYQTDEELVHDEEFIMANIDGEDLERWKKTHITIEMAQICYGYAV